MSGSTIGGIVGAGIGYFLAPYTGGMSVQWGWMIGSAIGGMVDPERIEGPRLGEARTQTASDGVPLIYGYGDFPCAGNVTWVDEVKEHRNKESAKGGPEQITYTYTISYMVVVCKGEISGLKLVRRNGKIVYDARTDSELTALGYSSQDIAETRAAQANFLQRATLYYGTDTQMPDPTMVAVKGAGNVPAYTGIAYIVMKDDETREGEYAQFEFVVANCGERHEDNNPPAYLLVTGNAASTGSHVFARALAQEELAFEDIPTSSGADMSGGSPGYYDGTWMVVSPGECRYSSDMMETWATASNPVADSCPHLTGGPDGWLAGRYSPSGSNNISKRVGSSDDFVVTTWSVLVPPSENAHVGSINLARYVDGYYYSDLLGLFMRSPDLSGSSWELLDGYRPDGISAVYDIAKFQGQLYITCLQNIGTIPSPITRRQLRRWNNSTESFSDILINNESDLPTPWHLSANEDYLIVYCWGGDHAYTSADEFSVPHETGILSTRATSIVGEGKGKQIAQTSGRFFLISGNGPDTERSNRCVSTEDGITFTDPVPLGIAAANGIAASDPSADSHWISIPDSPGYYIDPVSGNIVGPPGTQIDPCQPSLGEIVADQCGRRGVDSRDVSELTDHVGGYRVAKPSSPQANIQGLQPGYFFEASEFDGTLHFPKRGRPITFTLTHDDFLERDGDPIKWERTQERDFLRKVTVAYADPETAWTPTTQQAERRAATISAEGESTLELPITGTKDWAAQTAHKAIKVAWGEPDQCTFHVTIDYANLVTGAEGLVPYTDGNPTQIRIDRIEDEGLTRMITGRITRPDLYESNATGASKPLPQFPGSNIRGPTDGVLMNIPVLVDSDDRPGIHWAASRMLSGWQGAQLQIQRAGQWVNVGQTESPAAMGALLSPLPAHSGDLDTVNTLHVRMNEDMESVTYVNLLQERNPLAILRPDGTAEIVQFQVATEVADGEFELSTLLRGRLATTPDDHATGARVVFLDERVQYASLEPTDIGTTLEYRFISLGTDPDAAPIQTLDLTTMESQMEWPVDWLQVSQDGDDYTLTWLARDRLGNDVFPVRSANWSGYQVSYDHAGGSGSVVVNSETHTFNLPGASDITFTVAQLNQFTGAGPAQSVVIP